MDQLPAEVPIVFSQAEFDEFARLSGDDNPIHVDPSFAAETKFGRTVAHGMFIFAATQAAVTRIADRPVTLTAQEFVFSKPTFARDRLTLMLDSGSDEDDVDEQLVDSSGDVTSSGRATLGSRAGSFFPVAITTAVTQFKGLRPGMGAGRVRHITRGDVDDYLALTDDPNPLYRGAEAEIPPPLLGGAVSWVLGVDLPGPGTNWINQTFRFHEPVPVGSELRTSVTITRLRPEKELVNLSTVWETPDRVVATGEALVLVSDLVHR